MKVKDLRALLAVRGLPTTGVKTELIKRLEEANTMSDDEPEETIDKKPDESSKEGEKDAISADDKAKPKENGTPNDETQLSSNDEYGYIPMPPTKFWVKITPLPKNIVEDDLIDAFQSIGDVKDVSIFRFEKKIAVDDSTKKTEPSDDKDKDDVKMIESPEKNGDKTSTETGTNVLEPYALIAFENENVRDSAIGYQLELKGNKLDVAVHYKPSEQTALWIANLGEDMTDTEVREKLEEVCGVKFKRFSHKNHKRGNFCFTVFDCLKNASNSLKLFRELSFKTDGSKLKVEFSSPE